MSSWKVLAGMEFRWFLFSFNNSRVSDRFLKQSGANTEMWL